MVCGEYGDIPCDGRNHVACDNPNGNWSTANCPCYLNRSLLYLGIAERSLILFLHNQWRNNIALGIDPNYKIAARMAEMVGYALIRETEKFISAFIDLGLWFGVFVSVEREKVCNATRSVFGHLQISFPWSKSVWIDKFWSRLFQFQHNGHNCYSSRMVCRTQTRQSNKYWQLLWLRWVNIINMILCIFSI